MELVDTFRELEGLDVSCASSADVVLATQSVQRLRGFLLSREADLARRAGELHEAGEGHAPEDVIQRGSRSSQRDAAKTAKRARTLGEAPAVDRSLATGRISAEHVDALASVAGRLDDDIRKELFALDQELAGAAAAKTPEQFRRHLIRTADRLAADDGIERSERQRDAARLTTGTDADTGMGWINAKLHPDDFQKIRRQLDAEVAVLRTHDEHEGKSTEQLAAIAYVDLMEGRRASAPPPAEVIVLIDHESLVSGPHAESVVEYSDGATLPVEAARRRACDAKLIPAVLDSDGMPLDVGRGSRLATPSQRRALRSMYRTCAIDRCERHFDYCEIHHLDEWDDLGDTDLDNLLPLCSHHHHRAHEGRWRLQLDPSTRQLEVWLPDGTRHSRSRPDLMSERAERAERQQQAGQVERRRAA